MATEKKASPMLQDFLGLIQALGPQNLGTIATYRYRKAWVEARWGAGPLPRQGPALLRALRHRIGAPPGPVWPARWTTPGRVRYIQPGPRGATLIAERGSVEVLLLAPDLVRVRYLPHAEAAPEPLPYAIARPPEAWPAVEFAIVQDERALLLRTTALTIGVLLDEARVFCADADGRLLRADVEAGWGARGAVCHRVALAPDERIFGLGERATSWNRRGRTHVLWNRDPAGYTDNADPINMNIPVYVGVLTTPQEPPASYLVFYENPYYAEFDLGEHSARMAEHRFAGGEIRYYFGAGALPDLLTRYTELTGRHEMQPLWMLGYQQSRWSYYPEARVRQLAQDFRTHEVPCDAIHLDIDYMDGFRCFTWDRTRFPDLPGLAADLRAQGIKLITILDPGIKQDPHYTVYQSGIAGGHFCKTPDGQVFHAPVWPGDSAFPDFTAAAARAWWGEQYRPLLEAGIAGFWNDMNEPSTFIQDGDPTLPDPVRHILEGRGGDHAEAHNLYGMQMVRATREGLLQAQPDRRPVVITRAGWAGVQRHATAWTGDNVSSWESLRLTLPLVLGLGLSGVGFTGPDVGGFVGAADGELFTRWIQLSTFMPFFRAHTTKGSPDQEPWSYGEPYLSIVRRFIQLRYELLPYLYTALWQMTTRGWPMVRPLWWVDPGNPALYAIDDAFLCGDALLVAPVGYPGAINRSVTLPQGDWYDFWTNRLRHQNEPFDQLAPLEMLPLFVRAGSVLTLGEFGPSVEQRVQKFLRLGVYPFTGAGEAVSLMYEDAGEGMSYREGDCRVNRFVLRQTAERLTLDWESEGRYVPPYEHIELTLNGLKRAPQAVIADGQTFGVIQTDAVRRTALLGVPLFRRLEVIL